MSPRKRKTLASYGKRGDHVRVLVDDGRDRVIVHYRDTAGVPHRRFFGNDRAGRKEATTWAETYHATRKSQETEQQRPRTTLRALFTAFIDSEADNLREKTIAGYKQRFAKWELFFGASALADDTTLHDIDRFKAAARKSGMVSNQVRNVINVARIVYNWGQKRKLVHTNELAIYRWKQSKDTAVIEPAEYTEPEFEQLLRQFDPTRQDQWRPWVALMLFGHHGMRANAVRHLRWSDIDEARGVITWPARFMKAGKAHVQPIMWETVSALRTARAWREPAGVESDWVLFAPRNAAEPYSYQSLHYQLRQAEGKAEIKHLDYRGAHGFRKLVFNRIARQTKDPLAALAYIGDTDVKVLRNYDRLTEERIAEGSKIMATTESK